MLDCGTFSKWFFAMRNDQKPDPRVHKLLPRPGAKVAEPPPHLEEPERVLWQRFLIEYRFGTEAERSLLGQALTAHMRERHCRGRIDDQGEAMTGRFGSVTAHPLLRAEIAYRDQYLKFLSKLRITVQ
jgi:hypothetical protein